MGSKENILINEEEPTLEQLEKDLETMEAAIKLFEKLKLEAEKKIEKSKIKYTDKYSVMMTKGEVKAKQQGMGSLH